MIPIIKSIAVISSLVILWNVYKYVTSPENYSFSKSTSQSKYGVKCRSCTGTGWFNAQKCLPCGGDGVRGN